RAKTPRENRIRGGDANLHSAGGAGAEAGAGGLVAIAEVAGLETEGEEALMVDADAEEAVDCAAFADPVAEGAGRDAAFKGEAELDARDAEGEGVGGGFLGAEGSGTGDEAEK